MADPPEPAYDGAGRRVSATVDAVTTDFTLDVRGLGTVLSDGTRRFLPGAPNAGHEQGGNWVNALADQRGSVLGYADASGLVGSLTHYDPFGVPLPGETGLGTGPGFSGEWSDATGLLNLRARAYDPTLHSFLSRDSFGGFASTPLTANRYAYALGNPLRFTDPSGHFVAEFLRHPGLWASVALQIIPGIGDAYSFASGAIGFDPIAGISLSGAERGLAMAGGLALGGGFHLLGRVDDVARAGNRVDAVGDVGGGLRRSSEFGGIGRSADELGGVGRSGDALGGVRAADPRASGPSSAGWSRGGGQADAPVRARGTDDAARRGETVTPLGRTYERYDTYLTDVARHYGINLRGITPAFDYSLTPSMKGLRRAGEGGWIIRINPGFADEADLANTIAHELHHARAFQRGLPSPEAPAYAAGNALEEWIRGFR